VGEGTRGDARGGKCAPELSSSSQGPGLKTARERERKKELQTNGGGSELSECHKRVGGEGNRQHETVTDSEGPHELSSS